MFEQENLQELLQFSGGEEQVVSVYLDADLTKRTQDKVKLQVRALLKEAGAGIADDAVAIEKYFEYSFPWGTPGVAVFSCAAADFFRAYPIAIAFRNRLRMSSKPYVKPLVHILDHYKLYGVAVVDQIGAQFYVYHLGELLDSGGVMGEDVRKVKRGSGSSAIGMRGGQGGRTEHEQALRNMRDSAAAAEQFFSRSAVHRLFIGGTSENVALFREQLSRKLQSCFAGSFPADMDAGELEIRKRSLARLREINAQREDRLVNEMLSASAAGGQAVAGLGPTLRMVSDGRVDTLIVSDGFRVTGYLHDSSGYLAARADEELFGSNGFTELTDVVEEAITRTLEQSGHVEFVSENVQLEEAGRIGAILRY